MEEDPEIVIETMVHITGLQVLDFESSVRSIFDANDDHDLCEKILERLKA